MSHGMPTTYYLLPTTYYLLPITNSRVGNLTNLPIPLLERFHALVASLHPHTS